MRAFVGTCLLIGSHGVSSPPAGSLYGLFRQLGSVPYVCNVSKVYFDGTNDTFASTACDGITETFPSLSAFDTASSTLVLAIASASNLLSINVETNILTPSASLPQPYNTSDPFIGLFVVSGKTYLVTQFTLYMVTASELAILATYPTGFSAFEPQAAASSTGGSNGAGRAFVSDGSSRSIAVIDLGNPINVTFISSGSVSGPWDLQYSAPRDELLELVDYQLYGTNSRTGKTRHIITIPDGPGYPRVNGLSSDGEFFYFMDFSNLYTISVAQGTILSKAPIFSAPLTVGFPVWLSK